MKNFKICELNDIYGRLLTERQSAILRDYYDYDLSYAEIADSLGITRQGVGQIIDICTKQLECYEDILGLFEVKLELKKLRETTQDNQTKLRLESIIAKLEKQPIGE